MNMILPETYYAEHMTSANGKGKEIIDDGMIKMQY